MRSTRLFALAALAAIIVAACGSSAATSRPTGAVTVAPSQPSGGGAAIDIVDGGFEPADLQVAVGDTVTWTNTGSGTHTVTFDDGEDSGSLAPAAEYDRTFGTAGAFPYVCSFHSSMQGTITVTE